LDKKKLTKRLSAVGKKQSGTADVEKCPLLSLPPALLFSKI